MITYPTNCNLCGASLEINPKTNFATCSKCGTKLAIVRTPTSIFTEVVDAESVGKLADQLNELALQTELNRIDLEWQREREKYMIQTQYGKFIPGKNDGIMFFLFLLVVGIVFIISAATLNPASVPGIMFGIFPIIIGIAALVLFNSRFVDYKRAESEYTRRREAVIVKHR
jgi:hypothetical protein